MSDRTFRHHVFYFSLFATLCFSIVFSRIDSCDVCICVRMCAYV